MNFRASIVVAVAALLLSSALLLAPENEHRVSAQANMTVTMNIVGLPPRNHASGAPVLVSGIWHDLTVTKQEDTKSVKIEIYKGGNLPVTKNETNYYYFEYNDTFQGSEKYIDIPNCAKTGNELKFRIGLHISVDQCVWSMAIFADGEFVETKAVFVEALHPAVSFYSPDIRLRVEPFTVATVSSEAQNLKVSMSNDGNVPMNYSVEFESFSSSASMTGVGEVTNPNNMSGHFVKFSANNLKPGIIKINSTISACPQLMINASFINLIPAFGTTFRFEVYIGRAGYEIEPFSNIVVQYPREVPMNHSETRDISVYITGSESQLEFSVTNIKLKGVKLNDASKGTKDVISIPSSEKKENVIKFTVNANRPEIKATIKMIIKDMTTAVSKPFTINIPVGPRNITGGEETTTQTDSTPAMLFLVVSMAAIGGIMGIFAIRKKVKDKKKAARRKKRKSRNA